MDDKKYAGVTGLAAPGVCLPWEVKSQEAGYVAGDPKIIKQEWDKLDEQVYRYIWWWVHR